jgi:hypothetical protein
MGAQPRLCPPCVAMLGELCRIGKDARLCEAYEGYISTGDVRWVERASEVAPPDLLRRAKAELKTRAVLPPGA